MMKKIENLAICAFLLTGMYVQGQTTKKTSLEKTAFQTSGQWKPVTDVRSDVAIVYGTDDRAGMTFEQRVQSWRDKGYTTHFMTGIAWGQYQDYFTGKWDGKMHLDEGQVQRNGDTIWHGHMVPYIVPTENYIRYMKEKHVKRAIDAGIDAIYMEEPEFWARSGYSESFKKAWKEYYGFDWRPPHESPENTYLSSKLKYQFYYHALDEVFTYAKAYGKSKGMNVRCYVPTHSLVNYSQWQIVSPEASLASLKSVDGYIAQVWTGTSREPNYFNGIAKERVFETAFLEYGSMESMTAPTGRKMFFLTDPIEDRQKDWVDYKKNYQATFVAELMYPRIADYEVMPWPDRIYEGLYPVSAGSSQKAHIPRPYSTQMQVMINSLNDMPLSDHKVDGTEGISVLMSNSLMFQRFPTHAGYEDPQLSNFYGLALPFLKRGVPVRTVHMENLSFPETLKDTKVLLMTYSNMKPMDSVSHRYLSDWVHQGGTIVYCATDTDPFQTVKEWWNQGTNHYERPSDHLFEKLGIGRYPKEGSYPVGKGLVQVIRSDPKSFAMNKGGDQQLLSNVVDALKRNAGVSLALKNHLYLERGPYDIVAVLDESVSAAPYEMSGIFIDLFDPALPVLDHKKIQPGEQALLYNVERVPDKNKPQVLAAASRVYEETTSGHSYSFVAKSPLNTTNVMRVLLPSAPKACEVKGRTGGFETHLDWKWDETSKTCWLTFENHPDGMDVKLSW